jgi:hypothetical protein
VTSPTFLSDCLNVNSSRSARCYKKLNSAGKLIRRTTSKASQRLCTSSDWMCTRSGNTDTQQQSQLRAVVLEKRDFEQLQLSVRGDTDKLPETGLFRHSRMASGLTVPALTIAVFVSEKE